MPTTSGYKRLEVLGHLDVIVTLDFAEFHYSAAPFSLTLSCYEIWKLIVEDRLHPTAGLQTYVCRLILISFGGGTLGTIAILD